MRSFQVTALRIRSRLRHRPFYNASIFEPSLEGMSICAMDTNDGRPEKSKLSSASWNVLDSCLRCSQLFGS